jgi:hypothetical protein
MISDSQPVIIQEAEIRDFKIVPLEESTSHLTYREDKATVAQLLQDLAKVEAP